MDSFLGDVCKHYAVTLVQIVYVLVSSAKFYQWIVSRKGVARRVEEAICRGVLHRFLFVGAMRRPLTKQNILV
jgi:hypothetical protein